MDQVEPTTKPLLLCGRFFPFDEEGIPFAGAQLVIKERTNQSSECADDGGTVRSLHTLQTGETLNFVLLAQGEQRLGRRTLAVSIVPKNSNQQQRFLLIYTFKSTIPREGPLLSQRQGGTRAWRGKRSARYRMCGSGRLAGDHDGFAVRDSTYEG